MEIGFGSILCYSIEPKYTNHIKRIHLFDINEENIKRIQEIYTKFNIILTYE